MKSEALVMTIDFGKNHFNAILLNNELKMISPSGMIITVKDDSRATIRKQAGQAIKKLVDFFRK